MPGSLLCRLCRGITAEALTSRSGYAHAARPEHLGNRGAYTCDLCQELGHDYVPDYDPSGDEDPDNNSGYSKWDLRLSVTRQDSRISNLKLTSEIWPGPDEEWTQELDSYYLLTPEGDPAAKHGIPTMCRDLTNTRSAETFAFIKSCLERCDHEHDCTSALELEALPNPSEGQTNHRFVHPARLMDLSGPDQYIIRLVQIELECPAYMTLSHCWGLNVPKECLTTKANVENRLKSFTVSVLPPSFQDAIEITRRLGVQFLWIDTLCIIQDSREDWAIESVKMGSIYQNSRLTIAASHAENSFGGCFNKQSISRDRASLASSSRNTIEITGVDSHGASTTLILFKIPFGDMPDILKLSPLDKRGWIFQERVLSPRTIHFTSTQVIWECREAYWFEDRIPHRASGAAARPISSILRPNLTDNTRSTLPKFTNDAKAARITDHWYDGLIADRYSIRAFTKSDDRLIALAGIASVYQRLTRDQYVAGLWASSLATGLTWSFRSYPIDPQPSGKSRFPTWSWASQDCPLFFHSVYLHPQEVIADPHFRLLDTRLEYAPGHVNEFSPVIGGFITVMGCLVDLVCEHGSCSYFKDWQKGWEGSCFVDEEYKYLIPAKVTALVTGRKRSSDRQGDHFLLLRQHGGRQDAYVRIGVARVEYSPFMNKGRWEYTTDKATEIREAWVPQVLHLY